MPTPRDTFDQQYTPLTAYSLDGDLLNKQHRVLEGVALRGGAAFADTTQGQANGPPAGVLGVAVITSASNLCLTAEGEIDAPCGNVNKYFAHFRYYDTDQSRWVDYDEDLRLDASGYWEGVVLGGGYMTHASQTPTSGPGYGAIPAFSVGDNVPCFYDNQRGWLVPIMSPPADDPGGELYTSTIAFLPETVGIAPNSSAVCVLEVMRPGDLAWVPRQSMCWHIPIANDYEWVDTRSMFVIFKAPSDQLAGTFVRLRIGKSSDYDLEMCDARLRLVGVGRASAASYETTYTPRQYIGAGGKVVDTGWDLKNSIPGRYKDSPTFNIDGGGNIEITYLDPMDCWFIAAHVELTIASVPDSQSQVLSSVSSSTYLSISSPSASSKSTQESTKSWTSLSSSTSGTATSTSSTQLKSTSTSDTSTRTDVSSLTSGSDFCTVTVVSDVECDEGGHVLRVCYRTIGFPKDPSKPSCSDQIGPEICYPCQWESTVSIPSASLTSTSSTQLLSTSSTSGQTGQTGLSDLSTDLSSNQSFNSDECAGYCVWVWSGLAWINSIDTCFGGFPSTGPAPVCDCVTPYSPGTFGGQTINLACNEGY